MAIFTLLVSYEYEGNSLLGVYSTLEAAEAAWEAWSEGEEYGIKVISRVVLDSPAKFC